MKNKKCMGQSATGITFFLLLILSLSGCGGSGGSSQVIQSSPSAPTGIQVVVSASNVLTISWSPDANTDSYNIYFSTSPGASKNSINKISGITSTNYIHTGLTSGNTYYYVVTALNSYGESSVSAEVYALLATPHPPGAVAAVAGDGQATVSWNTNGATSYNIYMASQPGVTKANYATLTGGMVHSSTTGTYTHTGLANGTPYYFVVTSLNGYYGESSESNEVSATPAAGSSPTVSGTVKYEDKEYGPGGFTGKTYYKAVRYAEVDAVDPSSGVTIVTATTDASGLYTLTIPPAYSAKPIYIRAISSASSPVSSVTPMVGVRDLSNALYAVAGSTFTASGAAMANISIPATSLAAGAFNALDVFTSGAQFVQSLSLTYPPALTAYWQAGNSNGTYYCTSSNFSCPYGEGIYILNSNGDTDEYDDDVLWHEYGHFIAAKYSKDDSPGGAHYLTTNDLDLRLSWSEGWGDFMPTSVKTWLSTTTPSLLSTAPAMATSVYVDTGSTSQSFDFGSPGGSPFIYSSNEAAVAKVLIDLRTTYGMKAVWDTFTSSYVRTATVTAPVVNLEVFWEGWNILFPADNITGILGARSILYSADGYEADNLINSLRPLGKAALGTAENHTLFGSADVDYIAFDAASGSQYTVRTTALKNGADTVISIIAPDQTTVVTSNDNTSGVNYTAPYNCDTWGECHENGFDILGSTASFTATVPGTYYVEVKSSPNRPLSAGRYGEYSVTITSP